MWKEKPLKELKQINMDWKTTNYKKAGEDVWANPNGNPHDNAGYYTQQTKFYDAWSNAWNDLWAEEARLNPVERDA